VFLLLETVYGAFDVLAKRRGVFKVETIGDCYVAACGVPTVKKDHALIMTRFARDIHFKMQTLTQELEVALGPDIADLAFRIGLHSGPITGEVLRGDNARFQLFGDAMNTASRIESTGERHRVHISKQTADLLIVVGKKHWVKPREEKMLRKVSTSLRLSGWCLAKSAARREPL
jgi:class 3 adenylate cyclase